MPIESFKDIACHVWAIDGYSDNKTAEEVNLAYVTKSNQLTTANNTTARETAIRNLIAHCRKTKETDENAKVYGGFRRGQKAPEHMWIEYGNYIYDTMPNKGLKRVDATPDNRKCPGWENDSFGDGAVYVDSKLTVSQKKYISENF